MSLFAIAICAGIATGLISGGALRNASAVPVHLELLPLVWAGLLLQLLAGFVPNDVHGFDLRYALVLVSYGLILVFVSAWAVVLHRRRLGRGLHFSVLAIASGLLLNALVISFNHGKPVSAHALRVAGRNPSTDVTTGAFYKHVPLENSTALPWLGDVIPTFPRGPVVSLGDFVLAVGIAALIASALRPRPVRHVDAAHVRDAVAD